MWLSWIVCIVKQSRGREDILLDVNQPIQNIKWLMRLLGIVLPTYHHQTDVFKFFLCIDLFNLVYHLAIVLWRIRRQLDPTQIEPVADKFSSLSLATIVKSSNWCAFYDAMWGSPLTKFFAFPINCLIKLEIFWNITCSIGYNSVLLM